MILYSSVASAGCSIRLHIPCINEAAVGMETADFREGHVFKTLIGTVDVNNAAEQCGTSACSHSPQLLRCVSFSFLKMQLYCSLILVCGLSGCGFQGFVSFVYKVFA